eukprot:jgi/Tetstr1/421400/TSEL_001167.t1
MQESVGGGQAHQHGADSKWAYSERLAGLRPRGGVVLVERKDGATRQRKPQCASGTASPSSGSPTGAMKVRRLLGRGVLRGCGRRRRMEGFKDKERRSGVGNHTEVGGVQRLASAAQLLHGDEFRRPAVSIYHRRRPPSAKASAPPSAAFAEAARALADRRRTRRSANFRTTAGLLDG